ncbi:gpi transamidase component pig-u [Anaeramoeba flamelloides]|uniref:Gpi transamidase component pig-u n=1 Tax=Anaeramoeba flamelloides TaxID=1746091 RepID=A0AAV7Z2Z2_9EUKA|nr:gpi transamidase component pig-u [Anaeramoeba flamelloides]
MILQFSLILLGILLRVAGYHFDLSSFYNQKFEYVTPFTSFDNLIEAVHLMSHGTSPYGGSHFHLPPIYLWLFRWVDQDSYSNWGLRIIFILIDLICCLLLFLIIKQTLLQQKNKVLKQKLERILPVAISSIYFLNPFTITSCLVYCMGNFTRLFILLSIYFAMNANLVLSTFVLSLAAYTEVTPALLIIPMILYCIKQRSQLFKSKLNINKNQEKEKEQKQKEEKEEKQKKVKKNQKQKKEKKTKQNNNKEKQQNNSKIYLQWFFGLFLFFFWWALLLILSQLMFNSNITNIKTLTNDPNFFQHFFSNSHYFTFLKHTYYFLLNITDLTPNIGLYWYLLTETFVVFRQFLVFTLQFINVIGLIPLTLRFHSYPLFLLAITTSSITILKAYPTLADFPFLFCLLVMQPKLLENTRYRTFFIRGFQVVIGLLSPFYKIWIQDGTGNANYLFGISLSFSFAEILVLMEMIRSAMIVITNEKDKKKEKNSKPYYISTPNKKLHSKKDK